MSKAQQPVRLHLILLAGGQGARAAAEGQDAPKQFRSVGRRLLCQVALEAFLQVPADEIALVSLTMTVPDPWRPTAEATLQKLAEQDPRLPQPVHLAPAGQTRTASTWNAARALRTSAAGDQSPREDDLVAVHDTARPFASAELLAAVTRAAAASGAAVPGVLVPDTIVQCFGCPDPTSGPALSADVSDTAQARAARYLDRASLLAVQTPQVFRWDRFHAAHLWAAEQGAHFTDDGGLLAVCGLDPVVVPGEADNWKVTTATDWERARALLD